MGRLFLHALMPHAARRIHRPGAMLRAMRLLLKWLLSAAALLCVAYLYSGVEVRSFGAALIAAYVVSLLALRRMTLPRRRGRILRSVS